MNIIKKIFSHFKSQVEEEEVEVQDEEQNLVEEGEESYRWEKVNFHSEIERSRYAMDVLDQITAATNELNHITKEFQVVDAYLHDIEEIETLPEEELSQLKGIARHVVTERQVGADLAKRKDKLKESRYYQIELQENEIKPAIEKMKEAEGYKKLIQQDMKRLESEAHAFRYRRHELNVMKSNLKGVLVIGLGATVVCTIALAVLQYGMNMDTQFGFMILLLVFAVVLTFIYMQNSNTAGELGRVNKDINRIIKLQNTVKIRYVNNAKLLDYLYMKYNVDSAKKLKGIWNCYLREKEEHKRKAERAASLAFYEKELLKSLTRLRIKVPNRWLQYTSAIVDEKEMVEVKHEIVQRRQALRERLDYNTEIGEKAKGEILQIVTKYPEYAQELQDMVAEYENRVIEE